MGWGWSTEYPIWTSFLRHAFHQFFDFGIRHVDSSFLDHHSHCEFRRPNFGRRSKSQRFLSFLIFVRVFRVVRVQFLRICCSIPGKNNSEAVGIWDTDDTDDTAGRRQKRIARQLRVPESKLRPTIQILTVFIVPIFVRVFRVVRVQFLRICCSIPGKNNSEAVGEYGTRMTRTTRQDDDKKGLRGNCEFRHPNFGRHSKS